MARGIGGGGLKWWSFKRVVVGVCCANLVVALVVFRELYLRSSSAVVPIIPVPERKFSEEQIKIVEESNRIRRASKPIELLKVVKKLKKELLREEKRRRWKLPQGLKQKLANEIWQKLNSLGGSDSDNVTLQREAVELWRLEKLRQIKRMSDSNSSDSGFSAPEEKILKWALEANWVMVMEDIGIWMPSSVTNTDHDDKPEAEPDEEEIIPGPPLPAECNAELHTDYDGAAVRWGLTHHKETAAECCQACFDHAKNAKPGEPKCNIWVYCPSEFGCYSPDIYEHKHQECWLKQSENPKLNFKDKYSESYRDSHPSAPVIVPWLSGVVRS